LKLINPRVTEHVTKTALGIFELLPKGSLCEVIDNVLCMVLCMLLSLKYHQSKRYKQSDNTTSNFSGTVSLLSLIFRLYKRATGTNESYNGASKKTFLKN
jgi:hypothetical protein